MQQTFSMPNARLGGIFIPHMNLQGLLSIISELTPVVISLLSVTQMLSTLH